MMSLMSKRFPIRPAFPLKGPAERRPHGDEPGHGAGSGERFHLDVPHLNATRAHDARLETEP